jgi:hypothetical protein
MQFDCLCFLYTYRLLIESRFDKIPWCHLQHLLILLFQNQYLPAPSYFKFSLIVSYASRCCRVFECFFKCQRIAPIISRTSSLFFENLIASEPSKSNPSFTITIYNPILLHLELPHLRLTCNILIFQRFFN